MSQAKQRGHKEASVNEPLQPLMMIVDVCQLLNLSHPKLTDLICEGLLAMRSGQAVQFTPTSLQRWLARREEIA